MNKKQPKVSVVVPIYGVEKYLNQCVDSILAQTLKDIEIILVDDGSKDKCPQIVDEYAKKDKRVIAIHQPNGGYGRAVNHGIEVATGEYIGIVESDDWIDSNMYEVLYNDAIKNKVDIVKGLYYEFFDTEDNQGVDNLPRPLLEISPTKNPFNIYEYPLPLTYHASIWTALYKTDMIKNNNIKVLEINKGRYADQNWRYETLLSANSIYWEKQAFYHYRLTNENASSFKKNNSDDIFQIYEELIKSLEKYKNKVDIIKPYLYIEIYRHMFWNLNRVDKKYYTYCLSKIQKMFKTMDDKIVNDTSLFTNKEKKIFFKTKYGHVLLQSYYDRYCKRNLQWLFSLKNSRDKSHKIFSFCGIKIKIPNNIFKYKKIIKCIDTFIPKNNKRIVFLSYPDFSDNAREYYEYLQNNHNGEYELIWIYQNYKGRSYKYINNKYHIHSIKGLWYLVISKYIVYTGLNISSLINFKKHILLQLWHGMPIKTLGYTEKNVADDIFTQYKDYGKYGYFFVSSDIFKLSMVSCFLMKPNKVFISGQAKTDCILSNRNREEISNFIHSDNYRRIIIYAPTYKEALRNKRRDIDRAFKNIFYCEDYQESLFFKFLEDENILFIIKPHPLDEIFYRKYISKGFLNHKNIKVLFDDDMKNNNFYFYDFFKFADLLITDFSSIAIDYLISKKPVIFLNGLSDEYNKKRGFILEDNYEILMPGAKVDSFSSLIKAINDAITVDSWKSERLKMLPLLYKYFDSNSSARIYEIMKGLK